MAMRLIFSLPAPLGATVIFSRSPGTRRMYRTAGGVVLGVYPAQGVPHHGHQACFQIALVDACVDRFAPGLLDVDLLADFEEDAGDACVLADRQLVLLGNFIIFTILDRIPRAGSQDSRSDFGVIQVRTSWGKFRLALMHSRATAWVMASPLISRMATFLSVKQISRRQAAGFDASILNLLSILQVPTPKNGVGFILQISGDPVQSEVQGFFLGQARFIRIKPVPSGPNHSPVFMATPAFHVKEVCQLILSHAHGPAVQPHQISSLGRNQPDLGQLLRQTLL